MENLYLQLYTFSLYDKVVKEARRKIDVNRILVDDVRSAITEEKRRTELIKALQKLEK
jgi:translin